MTTMHDWLIPNHTGSDNPIVPTAAVKAKDQQSFIRIAAARNRRCFGGPAVRVTHRTVGSVQRNAPLGLLCLAANRDQEFLTAARLFDSRTQVDSIVDRDGCCVDRIATGVFG